MMRRVKHPDPSFLPSHVQTSVMAGPSEMFVPLKQSGIQKSTIRQERDKPGSRRPWMVDLSPSDIGTDCFEKHKHLLLLRSNDRIPANHCPLSCLEHPGSVSNQATTSKYNNHCYHPCISSSSGRKELQQREGACRRLSVSKRLRCRLYIVCMTSKVMGRVMYCPGILAGLCY
jgi:hypothetical protein